jgi:hypothetical protein
MENFPHIGINKDFWMHIQMYFGKLLWSYTHFLLFFLIYNFQNCRRIFNHCFFWVFMIGLVILTLIPHLTHLLHVQSKWKEAKKSATNQQIVICCDSEKRIGCLCHFLLVYSWTSYFSFVQWREIYVV